MPNGGQRRRRTRVRRAGSGGPPTASLSSPIAATASAIIGARTSRSRSMRGLAAATSAAAPSRAERACARYSSVRACRRSGVVSASTIYSYRLWSAVPLEAVSEPRHGGFETASKWVRGYVRRVPDDYRKPGAPAPPAVATLTPARLSAITTRTATSRFMSASLNLARRDHCSARPETGRVAA